MSIVKEYLKTVRDGIVDMAEMRRTLAREVFYPSTPQGILSCTGEKRQFEFRRYSPKYSNCKVDIISPEWGHFMTTFFDVDPISPSGRFMCCTQVPFIDHIPYPGNLANVIIIDLLSHTAEVVSQTAGWGAQLGANVQWCTNDSRIVFNDVIGGKGLGVILDLEKNLKKELSGPIFGLDPDRKYSFSANLSLINAGIPGYGIPEPFFNRQRLDSLASAEEGIWKTSLSTGETELFLSLQDIFKALPEAERLEGGVQYIFNVKVSPDAQRLFAIMFMRKAKGRAGWPTQIITSRLDGSDIQLAMPDRLYRHGGHHPNWIENGKYILMNLRAKGKAMRFVKFRPDGSGLETVADGVQGGGHPSINPSGTHLVTDAYVSEGLQNAEGLVPIRLINLSDCSEQTVAWINTLNLAGPRRVDPHPIWSRCGRFIYFNGTHNGIRQIFRANVSELIG